MPPETSSSLGADDVLASADLLGELGAPFHLIHGPDALVSRRALSGRGITAYLQNPYRETMGVTLALGVDGEARENQDVVEVDLEPLEVIAVILPVRAQHGSRLKLRIGSDFARSDRVREARPGHLNLGRSALGIASGIVGLLMMPVGHFSWSRSGGDTLNPLELDLTLDGPLSVSGLPMSITLWAPPGTAAHVARIRRRREGGYEYLWGRAAGYGYAAAISAMIAIAGVKSLPSGVSMGALLMIAIAGAVAFGCYRVLTGPDGVRRLRISRVMPGTGTGFVEADTVKWR